MTTLSFGDMTRFNKAVSGPSEHTSLCSSANKEKQALKCLNTQHLWPFHFAMCDNNENYSMACNIVFL